jgi:hypothetical protein
MGSFPTDNTHAISTKLTYGYNKLRMVFFNGNVHVLVSSCCLGPERFLKNYKITKTRSAASVSFAITLIGLALGFALLKLQGE